MSFAVGFWCLAEYYTLGGKAMEIDDRQTRLQAQQFLKKMRPGSDYDNYRVVSFPKEMYRAASFVKRIVPADQYERLNELFFQLWKLNEEFVGERISEVTVYLLRTGEHAALEKEFVRWCDTYCRARLATPNPKDKGSSYVTFLRLLKEHMRVVGMERRPRALDYLCLERCHGYTAWLLFENTWKDLVAVIHEGKCVDVGADPRILGDCPYFVNEYGFGLNGLAEFLAAADSQVCPEEEDARCGRSREELCREITGLMSDIWQMRPFLARNLHPEKTVMQLGDELFIACDWSAYVGVMKLITSRTERELLENVRMSLSDAYVEIDRNGILIDRHRPWITADGLDGIEHVRSLAINAHVLSLIHERLFSFYEKVDLGRIREKATPGEVSDVVDDDVLALSLEDLSSEQGTNEEDQSLRRPVIQRLKPLRLDRFLNVLERRFSCEVESGKGSETTVFRPGGKKFRLGHLKEVDSTLLKRVLQRLGITVPEWLRTVYG